MRKMPSLIVHFISYCIIWLHKFIIFIWRGNFVIMKVCKFIYIVFCLFNYCDENVQQVYRWCSRYTLMSRHVRASDYCIVRDRYKNVLPSWSIGCFGFDYCCCCFRHYRRCCSCSLYLLGAETHFITVGVVCLKYIPYKLYACKQILDIVYNEV